MPLSPRFTRRNSSSVMSPLNSAHAVLKGDNFVGWFQATETALQKAGLYETTKGESAFMQIYIKDKPVVKENYEAKKVTRQGVTIVPLDPKYPEFEEPVLADVENELESQRQLRYKAAFEEAKFRYQMNMDKYKHSESLKVKAEKALKNQQIILGIITESVGTAVTHMSVAAKTGGEKIDMQYEYWVAHAEEHIQACRTKLEHHKYEGQGLEKHLEVLLQLIEGVQVAGGSLSDAERKSYLYQSFKDPHDTFSGLDSFVATSQTLGASVTFLQLTQNLTHGVNQGTSKLRYNKVQKAQSANHHGHSDFRTKQYQGKDKIKQQHRKKYGQKQLRDCKFCDKRDVMHDADHCYSNPNCVIKVPPGWVIPKKGNEQAKTAVVRPVALTNNLFSAYSIIEKLQNNLVFDTGATVNIIDDPAYINITSLDRVGVEVAGGEIIYSSGKGLIYLETDDGQIIELEALLVENTRLLSIPSLMTLGWKLTMNIDSAILSTESDQTLTITGKRGSSGLTYLTKRCVRISDLQAQKELSYYSKMTSPGIEELYHKRLGHTNYSNLMKMARDEAILDLPINAAANASIEKPICFDCAAGKMTNTTGKGTRTRAERVGQVVHIDLCPLPEDSNQGSRHFVTSTDDFSGHNEIQFLATKDEQYEHIVAYINKVKTKTNREIEMIVCDNELITHSMKSICESKGITLRPTIPYQSDMNGVAERRNRTILDVARTILHAADLDNSYWEHACHTANYLLNRTSNSVTLGGQTPFESWTGKKPSAKNLRVFGTYAMVYISQKRPGQNKLSPRSERCLFVGYALNNQGWIFQRADGILFVSNNAIFDESDHNHLFQEPRSETDLLRLPLLTQGEKRRTSDAESPVKHQAAVSERDRRALKRVKLQNAAAAKSVSLVLSHQEQGQLKPNHSVNTHAHQWSTDESERNSQKLQQDDDLVREFLEYHDINPSDFADVNDTREEFTDDSQRFRQSPDNLDTVEDPEQDTLDPEHDIDHNPGNTFAHTAFKAIPSLDTPDYRQALKSKDSKLWIEAMNREYASLHEHKTFGDLTDCPPGVKPIPAKWVLKIKYLANGMIDKYKARLVAKGFHQRRGKDFSETFAPVARYTSVRMIMAIAASRGIKPIQLDVKTAFLHGDMDTDGVYLKQPAGYEVDGKLSQVYPLLKSLYGLRQASRIWHAVLVKCLKRLGMTQSKRDPCILYQVNAGECSIFVIFVDDIQGITSRPDYYIQGMREDGIDVQKIEEAGQFLGMRTTMHLDKFIISLDQTKYIEQTLVRFNMQDCNAQATPMSGIKLSKNMCPQNDEEKAKMATHPYREVVGTLMYLATTTRPDIAFATGVLSRYLSNPGEPHWVEAKRILRYLKGTKDLKLMLGGRDMTLKAYADADFAGDPDRARSTSGYAVFLGSSLISWRSKLQESQTALSTVEAEYYSICASMKEVQFLLPVCIDMDIPQETPIEVFEDNQGTIAMTENPIISDRSKHINVKYHFARDLVEDKTIKITYCPTQHNIADIFTKSLPRPQHQYLTGLLGLVNSIDELKDNPHSH
jgi:hypothetical protein